MFFVIQARNVLSTVELTAHLKQDREKWRAMSDTCINFFCPGLITLSFLRFHSYNVSQAALMNDLRNIRDFFPALNDDNLIKLLLYGNDLFNDNKNRVC